ncbi:EamA family transporter [Amycolatopsis jejuensis]|uniref:EamA family transporter n=1 Tax=Amycolatopsis jejuensis TaxID=330084 RepID=UPI0006908230|nr:EamA family transporter [Amycolatopsis jejuensis]
MTRARATGLSLTSWVLFASSGPLAKSVMDAGWSPAATTAVRIGLAALLLVPYVAIQRPQALRFHRKDLWLPLAYGLLGVAGVQLSFFIAVERIPVGTAMVLVNLSPVLVALWIRTVRHTQLPIQVWLGIGLALTGLVLISGPTARLDILGVAAGLASAVCSAGYFLLGEHGAQRHDSLGLTAAGLTIGAIAVLALSPLWTINAGNGTIGQAKVWLIFLTLAGFGTVLPYLAGLRALRDLPVALAGVLALAEPLVATLLAWLLLDQAPGATQLTGIAVLILGAALVSGHAGNQHTRHSHSPDVTSSPPRP